MSFFFCKAVDFYNEVSLIWGILGDIGIEPVAVGVGFPEGFHYRWSDGSRFKSPQACSGPQYVEFAMRWIEGEINNEALFPTSECKYLLLL
jgi:MOB kinase activator 1